MGNWPLREGSGSFSFTKKIALENTWGLELPTAEYISLCASVVPVTHCGQQGTVPPCQFRYIPS